MKRLLHRDEPIRIPRPVAYAFIGIWVIVLIGAAVWAMVVVMNGETANPSTLQKPALDKNCLQQGMNGECTQRAK